MEEIEHQSVDEHVYGIDSTISFQATSLSEISTMS